MDEKASVIIVDDHPLVLKALYDQLIGAGFNVVAQAKNGKQALDLLAIHKPTLTIIDLDLPIMSGFEVIEKAKSKGVDTKFIVLTFHKENEFVTQAKAMNIQGFMLKEDSFRDIEKCIKQVLNNRTYYSPSFSNKKIIESNNLIERFQLLTPSEIKIMSYISKGLSTKDIAGQLFLSVRTVDKHRSNIIEKLRLEKKTNTLMVWAMENKEIIDTLIKKRNTD